MSKSGALFSRKAVTTLVVGTVLGLNEVAAEISLAALIFSGVLSPYLANGITFILIGSVISILIMGYTSSFRGMVSMGQDIPAAILGVIAAGITASLEGNVDDDVLFLTVLAAIFSITVLTGLVFIVLGYFRLGTLFRFLPYPVIGGFLAGTGWLLAIGGIGVMVPLPGTFVDLFSLFNPTHIGFWLPGLVFAVVLYLVLNRWNHFLIFPGFLFVSVLIFYGVAVAGGASWAALETAGYLLGPFPEGWGGVTLMPIFSLASITAIRWDAIVAEGGNIVALIILSSIALLLNASGIELFVKKDIDLNQELIASGLSSVGAGVSGGIVAYPAVGFTTLGHSLGGRGRLLPTTTAVILLAVLLFGTPLLPFIPRFIFGGLLFYLGLDLLVEWIGRGWQRFSTVEYIILLGILLTIATIGFLQGVILGLFLAIGLFVYNYSRVSVVKHVLTGREFGSLVTRHPHHRETLIQTSDQIIIFQLDGFLFFGTAYGLLEDIRTCLETAPIRFLILDFQRVSGLDSTVVLTFNKLVQLTKKHRVPLVFAPPPRPDVSSRAMAIMFDDLVRDEDDQVHLFPSLDSGLEWCENQLLITAGYDISEEPHPLHEFLAPLIPDAFDFGKLLARFERLEVDPQYYLMRQGDEATAMYFIESGQVTAQLEPANSEPVRLETMRGGRIVGEIGFFLDQPRTAAVVADEPTVLYRLSADTLNRMKAEDPKAAHVLQDIFLRLVAERLTHLITTVEALKK